MKRKLIYLSAMIALLAALTLPIGPVPQQNVQAAPSCSTVESLCRDISAAMYRLCVYASGGDYTTCARNEAEATINCLNKNGCL